MLSKVLNVLGGIRAIILALLIPAAFGAGWFWQKSNCEARLRALADPEHVHSVIAERSKSAVATEKWYQEALQRLQFHGVSCMVDSELSDILGD